MSVGGIAITYVFTLTVVSGVGGRGRDSRRGRSHGRSRGWAWIIHTHSVLHEAPSRRGKPRAGGRRHPGTGSVIGQGASERMAAEGHEIGRERGRRGGLGRSRPGSGRDDRVRRSSRGSMLGQDLRLDAARAIGQGAADLAFDAQLTALEHRIMLQR